MYALLKAVWNESRAPNSPVVAFIQYVGVLIIYT